MKRRITNAIAWGLVLSLPLLVALIADAEVLRVPPSRRLPPASGGSAPAPLPSPPTSPSPSQEPSPSPSPGVCPQSPFPTPTPGIPVLARQGGGWCSNGGDGNVSVPAGDICTVTNLNNSGAGSFRNCVTNSRSGPRTVLFSVGGTINLESVVSIRTPYLTIEGFSAPSPGITLQQTDINDRVLEIIMNHDIIIRGIRIIGMFQPCVNGGRNLETFMFDGDGSKALPGWDDENPTGNKDIILDHCTLLLAEDDIGSYWCDTKNATSQYNFYMNNFHPTTRGCKGWRAPDDDEARKFISDIGNVYYENGERQPMQREGCYDCDIVNNVVMNWKDYSGCIPNSPYGPGGAGIGVRDPPNWRQNGIGNIALTSDTWHRNWDCVWGEDNNAPVGQAKWGNVHWSLNLFQTGHNPLHCVSRPTGQAAYARNYPLTWTDASNAANQAVFDALIDDAGMPFPTAAELAAKAAMKTIYHNRLQQLQDIGH